MRLIVGLGNPGLQYRGTRHNVGFMVVDRIAALLRTNVRRRACGGLTGIGMDAGEELALLKPQTMMNLSGRSVRAAVKDLGLAAEDVIVIHDDAHLDPGRIRIREKGSAAGHKGVASIIEDLGTERFVRVRVGIGGAARRDLVDYVLRRFTKSEWAEVEPTLDLAAEATLAIVRDGADAAMNRYNQRNGQG